MGVMSACATGSGRLLGEQYDGWAVPSMLFSMIDIWQVLLTLVSRVMEYDVVGWQWRSLWRILWEDDGSSRKHDICNYHLGKPFLCSLVVTNYFLWMLFLIVCELLLIMVSLLMILLHKFSECFIAVAALVIPFDLFELPALQYQLHKGVHVGSCTFASYILPQVKK